MARGRSDKSKSKPVDKSVDKKKKMQAGRSDDDSNAESIGRIRSEDSALHHPLEPPAKPTERREQPVQEPAAEVEESNMKLSEETPTASPDNGHQGREEDSAMHRRVAERAFILFQESGCQHGNDWAHWFEAERQIRM